MTGDERYGALEAAVMRYPHIIDVLRELAENYCVGADAHELARAADNIEAGFEGPLTAPDAWEGGFAANH